MSELCMKYLFEQANSADHPSNKQESYFKITNRITERCQRARNALYAISAQCLNLYGLNPMDSSTVFQAPLHAAYFL